MMDLDELQSVRDRERQTDKLQQLRETFYADAGEFIQQLREQREHAADRADDPFDAPEVNRLSDEIDTAEQTVEAIYEKRVGKIVKAASFAAADLPAESDGMTAEEQELFETLVDDIKANRQHVLDVLAGEAVPTGTDADAPAQPEVTSDETGSVERDDPIPDDHTIPEEPTDAGQRPSEESKTPPPADADRADDSGVSAADVMGGNVPDSGEKADSARSSGESGPGETERETPHPEQESNDSGTHAGGDQSPDVRNDGGAATPAVERETVRITADVGDIFGVDEREYDLAENDVVTLPAANVTPLLERDAAERLD